MIEKNFNKARSRDIRIERIESVKKDTENNIGKIEAGLSDIKNKGKVNLGNLPDYIGKKLFSKIYDFLWDTIIFFESDNNSKAKRYKRVVKRFDKERVITEDKFYEYDLSWAFRQLVIDYLEEELDKEKSMKVEQENSIHELKDNLI